METIKEVVRIKQIKVETDAPAVLSPKDATSIAAQYIGDEDREVFLVLVLNNKNKINAIHRCHVGSVNASMVHPREVFKLAILNNATSIIVAHNHPSTDLSPSREDIQVTKRLQEAGEILGIELLDSLIVNDSEEGYSLKEKGHMDT